jgi:tRNA threonylcarbamoyladenosine biosynthesis protein TsaB
MIAQMSLYLGIDTSSPTLALALWSPGSSSLARFCEDVGRDHAKRLIPELERLFKSVGAKPADLRSIGVGIGPGSYTGLRVGLATARGLARGAGISTRGVGSLEARAWAGLGENVPKGVFALDARRGNVYAAIFEKRGETVTALEPVAKVAKADLLTAHPHLPYFEDMPPDAAYIARRAAVGAGDEPIPIYL